MFTIIKAMFLPLVFAVFLGLFVCNIFSSIKNQKMNQVLHKNDVKTECLIEKK